MVYEFNAKLCKSENFPKSFSKIFNFYSPEPIFMQYANEDGIILRSLNKRLTAKVYVLV